ncbi:hypothetical protein [Falsiroseomonas ponticola]|uniref:hypothetical protein n=1 Tax=Falsiroseomonas ponticola TaxID=2786951 RepID=UPI0019343028|nr:hypothetical protein [Roseomonas ponticola]
MPEPTPWWLDLIKVVGAGLFAAFATHFLTGWREAKKSEANARHLALQISVALERFAIECADRVGDTEMSVSSGGHAGKAHLSLPTLAAFPADGAWGSLESSLAARALAMPNELLLADQKLSFEWEISDADDVARECARQAALHGARAFELAGDLRSRYQLPSFDPTKSAWDVKAYLKRKRIEAEAIWKRQRES